jgi:hypothetical protein
MKVILMKCNWVLGERELKYKTKSKKPMNEEHKQILKHRAKYSENILTIKE